MNGNIILDAMDYVGDDLIDDYFRLRAQYESKKKRPWTRARWASLVAACLAAVILGTYGVQYIPKRYDLEYEDSRQQGAWKPRNMWIYYVDQNNEIKRERVRLDVPTIRNRIITWKHLNGIGDEVWVTNTGYSRNDVKRGEDGSFIWDETVETQHTARITLSDDIKEYDGYELLLEALKKTELQFADECEITLKPKNHEKWRDSNG